MWRGLLLVWLVGLACLTALPAQALEPLAAEARTKFLASPEDPPAQKLLGTEKRFEGAHYLTGDEGTPHVWHAPVAGLGGGYLGVGAEQAYLLMGWQRAEIAWLIDYDPLVLDMHALYRAFFVAAATPAQFWDLWRPAGQAAALQAIAATPGEPKRIEHLQRLYRQQRGRVLQRLRHLLGDGQRHGVSSFLDDTATYEHVRGLWQGGRIRPLSANLLGTVGLAGIAKAARELGVTLRVVYLSNAEEYWRYGPAFRTNLSALPYDEKSLIVRSLAAWRHNRDYRYNVQPARLFVAWLAQPGIRWVRQLVVQRAMTGPGDIDFTVATADPAKTKNPKQRGK